jgi:hypothetical protein
MKTITNDEEFRTALNGLSQIERRIVGLHFLNNVMDITDKKLFLPIISLFANKGIHEGDFTSLMTNMRKLTVESHARCGSDTDWLKQAQHFVAKAAYFLTMSANDKDNLAQEVAMAARIARNFVAIAEGKSDNNEEVQAQYQILVKFIEDKQK